jgi:hypothetical protein
MIIRVREENGFWPTRRVISTEALPPRRAVMALASATG